MSATKMQAAPKAAIVRGRREEPAPARVARLAAEAIALKRQELELAERRREIEAKLIDALGPGASVRVEGEGRLTITEQRTIRIADPEALRAALGPRFADLVAEQVRYVPRDALKEMLWDASHPLAEALRGATEIDRSASVSYRLGA